MNVLARAGVCWLVLACFSMTLRQYNAGVQQINEVLHISDSLTKRGDKSIEWNQDM